MMMLPGQLCVLQDCEEVEDPAQEFPPLAGAGLLQDLDRDWVPLAHDLVHPPYEPQAPQFPWTTGAKTIYKIFYFVVKIVNFLS